MSDERSGTGRRSFLATAGAVAGALSIGGITEASPGRAQADRSNELLVGVSNGTGLATAQARVEDTLPSDATVTHRNETIGYMAVEVPDSQASASSLLAHRLRAQSGVKYVEPNERIELVEATQTAPDDPHFDDQYVPQQVDAPEAWETTEAEDVTVAIIDTGADYDHADLAARFGEDKGYDFADDDENPHPDIQEENHGTHVSGICAGTTNNDTGVAGVSNAHLLSVRVLGANGRGWTSDIVDGIQWAADQGAVLGNVSIASSGGQALQNAVSYALDEGLLLVCAAGNDGVRGITKPASYDETLAVSAIDEYENFANFSQYGPKVDVTAGGVSVLSTVQGGYEYYNGTSMATPAATGVAALGKAAHPDVSPTELRQLVKDTAEDIGLDEERQGAGLVNAANVVQGGDPDPVAPNAEIEASTTTPDCSAAVTFDASPSTDPDGGEIQSYEWSSDRGDSATGETVEWAWDESGDVQVSLTVTDDEGQTDSTALTVHVTDNCGGSNEGPTAEMDLETTEPTVGEDVSADGSASTDPDGSISSYEWRIDGEHATAGETVSLVFDETGDHEVTLVVTDDDDASDATSTTVTVSDDDGGECGTVTEQTEQTGTLSGWLDEGSHTYTAALDDPCQLTISLSGPNDADFDLYVTFDGSEPSFFDNDRASSSFDSQETIVIEDVEAAQEFGVLVDAFGNGGEYTLTYEEIGR